MPFREAISTAIGQEGEICVNTRFNSTIWPHPKIRPSGNYLLNILVAMMAHFAWWRLI